MKWSEDINSFLRKYEMHPESISLSKETANFIKKMDQGLTTYPGSLKMLCTYIPDENHLPVCPIFRGK